MAGNPTFTSNNDPYQIVRTYTAHGAPTGEGERFVLRDGSHWRRINPRELDGTNNLITRQQCGNRIPPGSCC